MILGMMTSTFTIVQVLISFAGIGSGLVVIYGLLTGKRFDTWTAIFLVTTLNQPDWIPLSGPAPLAVSHNRYHIAGRVGRCGSGALGSPNGVLVALDLCGLRCACALSERIRRGGAVVYEDADCPRIGSDAKGAAVSRRVTGGDGDFRGEWYFRGEKGPRQVGVCPGTMGAV